MVLNVIDDLNKFIKPVQQFINNNYRNPFFWVTIVGIVLVIFTVAYAYLHKDK